MTRAQFNKMKHDQNKKKGGGKKGGGGRKAKV